MINNYPCSDKQKDIANLLLIAQHLMSRKVLTGENSRSVKNMEKHLTVF